MIVTRRLPLVGDLADLHLKVYVQVKQKYGVDESDFEGVRQLARITADDKTALKVLISTADRFTQQCKDAADNDDVILVGGVQVAELLTRFI